MKKFMRSAVALCSVLFLTACGSKEQSVTYSSVTEENGISMTDTMTLDAKGDKIQKITEVIEMDMSSFDDDQYAQMEEIYTQLVDMYNAVDGTECTASDTDKVLTMTITVDATGDAVSQLAEQGLMEIEGDSDGGLSLKGTSSALESSGYTKVD